MKFTKKNTIINEEVQNAFKPELPLEDEIKGTVDDTYANAVKVHAKKEKEIKDAMKPAEEAKKDLEKMTVDRRETRKVKTKDMDAMYLSEEVEEEKFYEDPGFEYGNNVSEQEYAINFAQDLGFSDAINSFPLKSEEEFKYACGEEDINVEDIADLYNVYKEMYTEISETSDLDSDILDEDTNLEEAVSKLNHVVEEIAKHLLSLPDYTPDDVYVDAWHTILDACAELGLDVNEYADNAHEYLQELLEMGFENFYHKFKDKFDNWDRWAVKKNVEDVFYPEEDTYLDENFTISASEWEEIKNFVDEKFANIEDPGLLDDKDFERIWEDTLNYFGIEINGLPNVHGDDLQSKIFEYICNGYVDEEPTIKIKPDSEKVVIDKEDTSEAGELGHPIQQGLRGKTSKLEAVEEPLIHEEDTVSLKDRIAREAQPDPLDDGSYYQVQFSNYDGDIINGDYFDTLEEAKEYAIDCYHTEEDCNFFVIYNEYGDIVYSDEDLDYVFDDDDYVIDEALKEEFNLNNFEETEKHLQTFLKSGYGEVKQLDEIKYNNLKEEASKLISLLYKLKANCYEELQKETKRYNSYHNSKDDFAQAPYEGNYFKLRHAYSVLKDGCHAVNDAYQELLKQEPDEEGNYNVSSAFRNLCAAHFRGLIQEEDEECDDEKHDELENESLKEELKTKTYSIDCYACELEDAIYVSLENAVNPDDVAEAIGDLGDSAWHIKLKDGKCYSCEFGNGHWDMEECTSEEYNQVKEYALEECNESLEECNLQEEINPEAKTDREVIETFLGDKIIKKAISTQFDEDSKYLYNYFSIVLKEKDFDEDNLDEMFDNLEYYYDYDFNTEEGKYLGDLADPEKGEIEVRFKHLTAPETLDSEEEKDTLVECSNIVEEYTTEDDICRIDDELFDKAQNGLLVKKFEDGLDHYYMEPETQKVWLIKLNDDESINKIILF